MLGIADLLCILWLGITYANEGFVKYILKLVEEIEPDFEMCKAALVKVYSLEQSGNLCTELTANIKAKCGTCLAKFFSPMEEKHK